MIYLAILITALLFIEILYYRSVIQNNKYYGRNSRKYIYINDHRMIYTTTLIIINLMISVYIIIT